MNVRISQLDYDNDEYFFGRCYAKDDFSWMYIPIEKNVTKVIRSMLVPHGFCEYNFHELKKYNTPALVILRDPVERWVSGVVEYLALVYLDTKQSLTNLVRHSITPEKVFEQIVFDAHTYPQTWFLTELTQCEYIWFDEHEKSHFIDTMSKYLAHKGVAHTWTNKNYPYIPDGNINLKKELTQEYTNLLQANLELMQKVKDFYVHDYELINSVKFYT